MRSRLMNGALATAFILAGCSEGAGDRQAADGGAQEDGQPSSTTDAVEGLRLYALDCGRIEMHDLSAFDAGGAYDGRTNEAADACFLIRHREGDLLWDTGLPDSLADEENGVDTGDFHLSLARPLKAQLEEIGLAPDDIDFLSLSHSHFDHTGNAGDYAGATFIVHEEERKHMFREQARADPQAFDAYAALENAETVTFTDEHDVFGDGSVRIIAMPGHTPGHSVLLVDLADEGPVLLTGDLYHLQEARERRTVPAFNTDHEETLRSMDAFEALAAETGARVVIQHVLEDFEAMPQSPAYLD